jgi:hypothetical protein
MRGAEYVAGVVSAYRAALDGIRAGNAGAGVAEGERILAGVFGREPTLGLTGGAAPGDVAAGGGTGNVGEPLGTVARVEHGWAFVPGDCPVAAGDRLRVQFREDGSGRGFSVGGVRAAVGGIRVKVPFPLSPGDLLFRVGSPARTEHARRARREMERIPGDGARFAVAASGNSVTVKAWYGETVSREFAYRVAGGGGKGDPVPQDAPSRLAESYRGDLPLEGVRVDLSGDPPAWSDLRALFRQGASQFDKEFHLEGKRLRMTILPALRVSGARPEGPPMVVFAGCRADQLPNLPRRPDVVPVVEFTRALARDPSPVVRHARAGAYLRLPPPLLESDAAFLRRTVADAVRKGATRWVLSDVGHFRLFAPFHVRRQVTLVSDHYLYAFNMGALSALSRLGAARMVLPVEATLPALRDVGKFLYGLGIAVAYGAVPLMTSRLLPAAGVRGGDVTSPKSERFHVTADEHGSAVLPAEPFSAAGCLRELRAAGIRDFFADLRGLPPGRTEEILSSLFADRAIPGTGTFNLFRGNF